MNGETRGRVRISQVLNSSNGFGLSCSDITAPQVVLILPDGQIRCSNCWVHPARKAPNSISRKTQFAERIQLDLGRPVPIAKIIRFSGR
jgi:hypothetical protein